MEGKSAPVQERSSGRAAKRPSGRATREWLHRVWWEGEHQRQRCLRIKVKHCCCCAGIVPMMIPYYCAFSMELKRHLGSFPGPAVTEQIGRQLVAKWSVFGLKPDVLLELVYQLTNHRLEGA